MWVKTSVLRVEAMGTLSKYVFTYWEKHQLKNFEKQKAQ
jgi:hypothetical protein